MVNYKKSGPYALGVNEVNHRQVVTTTILNTNAFDKMARTLDSAYDYDVGWVPAGYAHRPDLISNLFYGTPANWWLLMYVNGINDPFEGFKLNERILIPKL